MATKKIRIRHPGMVIHETLAHSYMVYLAAVLIGFMFQYYFLAVVHSSLFQVIGAVMIVLGTAVIYWAQSASEKSAQCRQEETVHHNHFKDGPYAFTRSPTHYGLFFMTLGLGFLFQSLAMIVLICAAFLITRTVFLPREERELERKYGAPYTEYKRQVRM